MKKSNKILSIIMALIMISAIIPMSNITADAYTDSGICGENLTWTFDDSSGILSISGTGAMFDFDYVYDENYGYSRLNIPWEIYNINTVIINYGVTTIGDYSFEGCPNLTNITIPDSITTIGERVFSGCHSLTSITIPDSVTMIGERAFFDCYSLTNITVNYNNQCFSNDEYGILFNKDKTTLIQYPVGNTRTDYIIPESVTTIGDYSFEGCYNLTNITIPDSVSMIGECAFSNCDSLTNITVNYNNQCFSNDEYGVLFNKDKTTLIQYPVGNTRTDYIIPESVTTIGDYSFEGCYSLTSIIIPSSVTSIGNWAFCYCNNLTKAIIPDSVTVVGDGVFAYCWSLANVTLSDNITVLGHYFFFACNSLENITIPNSVTIIGDFAFSCCNSLKNIIIPSNVTIIGNCAFESCENLKKIVIYDSVTTIVYEAFGYCPSLTDVYYSGTEEEWSKITIEENNEYLLNANFHFNYCEHQDYDGNGYCDNCNELLDSIIECDCNCHKSGIPKFFFNIILFFQKLFGSNKYCSCGVAHY